MITVAVAAVLLVVPALGSPLSTSTEPLIRGNVGLNLAPIVSHPTAEQAIIPNQYIIVVLKPEATLDDLNSSALQEFR
ncbi:protease rh-p3, putative, partial [Rhizoctonia solani AG-3 Rhs1AP]